MYKYGNKLKTILKMFQIADYIIALGLVFLKENAIYIHSDSATDWVQLLKLTSNILYFKWKIPTFNN